MTAAKEPRVISADECLDFYKELGGLRGTMKDLHRRIDRQRDDVRVPRYETMRKWSVRYDWKRRAREHDVAVGGRVSELRIDEEAKDFWDARRHFKSSSKALLEKVDAAIGGLELKTLSEISKASVIIDLLMARAGSMPGGNLPGGESTALPNEEDPQRDPDILERFKALTNGAGGAPN